MRVLIVFLFAICQFGFAQTGGGYNPPSGGSSINVSDSAWLLNGNSNTINGTNFIGTTDAINLSIGTNSVIRQTITSNGNVGIGTPSPTSKFQIVGSQAVSFISISATTTLNETHHKVLVSNGATNITITLPNALTCIGREYIFSRSAGSTGKIAIVGGAGNQIQALNGTIGATTSISVHTATGGGLNIRFTAINIGGVGTWIRL